MMINCLPASLSQCALLSVHITLNRWCLVLSSPKIEILNRQAQCIRVVHITTVGDIIFLRQKFAMLIMLHHCTVKNGLFVAVQWFKYT